MSDRAEPIAQNNLQLYAQLRRAGWASSEIEAVAAAYRAAALLLAGWYRPSGKPFVDHFVGTASIVVGLGARPAMVRAALLHNAYGGVLGAASLGRQELRAAIGPEAEELVWSYSSFAWDDAAVAALLERVDRSDPAERDLIVLRLANEIDDRSDLGLLHSQQERLDGEPMVRLAEAIDQPGLAGALRRCLAEEAAVEVEPGARNDERLPYRLGGPPEPLATRAVGLTRRVARRLRPGGR